MSAIDASPWKYNPDSIAYENVWPSGVYHCGTSGFFAWIANPETSKHAISVTWDAALRFAQTVVESYTITVQAPQSIAQYGTKSSGMLHSLDVEYDVSEWEKNEAYSSTTGLTASGSDYYIDQDGLPSDYKDAIETAINLARTEILKTHRKNTVTFETYLFPAVDLKHTVKIDTSNIVAQGKVTAITHTIDVVDRVGYTELELSFSTAQGSATDTTITAPARPTPVVVGESNPGILLINSVDDDLLAPAIDDEARNESTVSATASYNVEIPSMALTVTL